MSGFFHGHQRTHSQAQQLIPRDPPDDPCSSAFTASPYDSDPVANPSADISPPSDPPVPFTFRTSTSSGTSVPPTAGIRFSTLGSDCSSSYYKLPGGAERTERPITTRRVLRANLRVVLGSLALALLGTALLMFGFCVMIFPNDMDVHGWIFLVVGVLFAIPGFYHVCYIGCTLCGRPGYSFDNLPTFTKPSRLY